MKKPDNPSAPSAGDPTGAFALPFSAGDLIAGKYEVIDLIGAGAMGFVISARRIELGDKVAIKFLRPALLEHDELVARFVREARTAVMIQSEHVVRVFDVGSLLELGPFIAMEFLEGDDLSRVIHQRGPLPGALAVEYVLQACEALATAHASGIVHRDVKPENLFLTPSVQGTDVIKVLDFGISKVVLSEAGIEQKPPYIITMSTVGSPMYMSPEQVRASKDIDARCDIWGLGCVLYELLTGTAAFDALSLTELASKILEVDPVPMRTHGVDVPPALEALVFRCLRKDREVRFANIGELALELCPFAAPRAHVWAERSCHVLKRAAAMGSASMAVPSEPGESCPPSLKASVYDLVARSSPDAPLAGDRLLPFGLRESRFFVGYRRVGLVLGLAGMAATYALWQGEQSRSVSAGAGPLVLVTEVTTPAPPPAASLFALAAVDVAPASTVAEVKLLPHAGSQESRAAMPRDARPHGQPNRSPSRPRAATLAPPSAPSSRAREPAEAAPRASAAKTEGAKRIPLVGDDWRAELVE